MEKYKNDKFKREFLKGLIFQSTIKLSTLFEYYRSDIIDYKEIKKRESDNIDFENDEEKDRYEKILGIEEEDFNEKFKILVKKESTFNSNREIKFSRVLKRIPAFSVQALFLLILLLFCSSVFLFYQNYKTDLKISTLDSLHKVHNKSFSNDSIFLETQKKLIKIDSFFLTDSNWNSKDKLKREKDTIRKLSIELKNMNVRLDSLE